MTRERESRKRAASAAGVLALYLTDYAAKQPIWHDLIIAWLVVNVVYYVLRAVQERTFSANLIRHDVGPRG